MKYTIFIASYEEKLCVYIYEIASSCTVKGCIIVCSARK